MEEGWKEVFMTAHEYKAAMASNILENEGIKSIIINQQDSAYKVFGNFVVYTSEENYEKDVHSQQVHHMKY